MKKTLLTLAAAAIVALSACAGSTTEAAPADKQPTAKTAAAKTAAGSVITLKNDNAYRPGQKVKKLTILDFNATWCGPCRKLAPVFHDAAKKYGKVDFVSVDVDNMTATAEAFGIQAVPTVIFLFPDGTQQVYTGTDKLLPASALDALINAALKK